MLHFFDVRVVRSLVVLVGIHLEDMTAFRKSERIVLVLRITADFANEAAALAASWALVIVVLIRDALAVDEQPRVANARKPTEDGEQLLLLLCPPMELAAAAVSLCGVRGCICGRRVVELVLTAGPARALRCPPAADLTV